ncbi:MAG: pimeloyl-ACP methyl ester esterase BioH [Gammaproteobacteria bacterium]|nr:pimeloyl-ACP methyl ester esterase BioH [Gammaproteobacteria bacterium]MCP5317861.1 pimeloyl-ACP methyl ester esterase BioH [Chromatiaceae bacterium]MCP5434667.1 pimeloyl-ACP methyl ester esterase BioH [Chromatiaceae bacterium]
MSVYWSRAGSGVPLVLLHGWGMNAAVWEPLLPRLTSHFEVTVVELPGHGGSSAAPAADLDDWAMRCAAVAPLRAHWVGWSLGGQVALQVALSAPERVSGLSLMATTPRFVQGADWPCAMPGDTFRQFASTLGDDPGATLQRFLGLQVKGAEHARDTLRLLRAELAQRPPASEAGLTQGLTLLLETDLRTALPNLQCATQWLLGSRDTLVPLQLGEALRAILPTARVDEIAGAGHAPLLSHPDACLALLRDAAT